MNLFHVKQNQFVKIIDLKNGDQYVDRKDPVLERLELLGFRVGESLQVLEKGLFGGDPILVAFDFVYQTVKTKDRNPQVCFWAFRHNRWVGLIIFLGIFLNFI